MFVLEKQHIVRVRVFVYLICEWLFAVINNSKYALKDPIPERRWESFNANEENALFHSLLLFWSKIFKEKFPSTNIRWYFMSGENVKYLLERHSLSGNVSNMSFLIKNIRKRCKRYTSLWWQIMWRKQSMETFIFWRKKWHIENKLIVISKYIVLSWNILSYLENPCSNNTNNS